MKYGKYKLKTYRVNGIKMYDYANKDFNAFIANLEGTTNGLVIGGGQILVLKSGGGWIKGQIISNNEFSGFPPDEEQQAKEKKLTEQKYQILVSQAEKLISRPRKYDVLAHIRKMENSLEDAIDLKFYNLSA